MHIKAKEVKVVYGNQTNVSDCGVFVITYAQNLAKGINTKILEVFLLYEFKTQKIIKTKQKIIKATSYLIEISF